MTVQYFTLGGIVFMLDYTVEKVVTLQSCHVAIVEPAEVSQQPVS